MNPVSNSTKRLTPSFTKQRLSGLLRDEFPHLPPFSLEDMSNPPAFIAVGVQSNPEERELITLQRERLIFSGPGGRMSECQFDFMYQTQSRLYSNPKTLQENPKTALILKKNKGDP